MTLLERAARAAAEQYGEIWDRLPNVNPVSNGELDKAHFINQAIAILTAIRDVDAGSPAILVAGKRALYSCTEDPELQDARGCWQAMIDAMLEEGA